MNRTRRIAALAAILGMVSPAAFAMPSWQIEGARATTALNLLESRGDSGFTGFHAVGPDFAANVNRDGRIVHLLVHPGTGQIQTQT